MKNNKKGFTLVELLAVIVILGILLLVAVPSVSNIIKSSKQGVAKDEAMQVLNMMNTCSLAKLGVCDANEVKAYLDNASSITLTFTTTSGSTYDNITFSAFSYTSKDNITIETSTSYALQTLKSKISAGTGSWDTDGDKFTIS